jgi:hypothetical protein
MVSSSRVSTEQKDQELDTDQDIAKRLGAERAAKDHMPPTMFKLARATILLVSDTISSLFFFAYGVCWFHAVVACSIYSMAAPVPEAMSSQGATRSRRAQSDSGVGEHDGKHPGSSRV